jgi:GNAT superfamily N-acetyltransferase
MSTNVQASPVKVVRGFAAAQAHAHLTSHIPSVHRCDYEYDTPQEIIHFDTDLHLAGVPLRRWVVGEITQPLAVAFCFRATWNTPRHTFWAHIRLDPALPAEEQVRIGDELMQTVQQWASAAGAQLLRLMSHPDSPTQQMLDRHGYRHIGTEQKYVLDVAHATLPAVTPIAIPGYRVATLAELMQTHTDAIEQACQLHAAISLDVPMPDEPIVTITKFRRLLGEALDPQQYLLAMVDDMMVGESILMESDDDPAIYWQHATGVIPAYRGRGIAKHLKLHAIATAQAFGAQQLFTWMETSNLPILHLNQELGFREYVAPGASVYVYERALAV